MIDLDSPVLLLSTSLLGFTEHVRGRGITITPRGPERGEVDRRVRNARGDLRGPIGGHGDPRWTSNGERRGLAKLNRNF